MYIIYIIYLIYVSYVVLYIYILHIEYILLDGSTEHHRTKTLRGRAGAVRLLVFKLHRSKSCVGVSCRMQELNGTAACVPSQGEHRNTSCHYSVYQPPRYISDHIWSYMHIHIMHLSKVYIKQCALFRLQGFCVHALDCWPIFWYSS